MTVAIYTAPAAGGKTQYCIDLARQTAAGLEHEVRVVVPTRQLAVAWRKRLAEAGGAIGVRVLTYDELVNVCLDIAGTSYTEIHRPVQQHVLRMLIEATELDHYRSLRDKAGFVAVVDTFIKELQISEVPPEEMSRAIEEMGNDARLSELAMLYGAYQRFLREHGEDDRAGLGRRAVTAFSSSTHHSPLNWPLLIVDGFDYFTPLQLALFKRLGERVDALVLTVMAAEQTEFERYVGTQNAVEQAFEKQVMPLPVSDPPTTGPTNATLAHLGRSLFSREPVSGPAPDGKQAVTLLEAPDAAAEVRAALRWLKQQIVERGVASDEVALLARDLTPYRPFIDQIAAEFGLPVQLVDGQPLNRNPAIDALMELLLLFVPGDDGAAALSRRELVATWRSPYFRWGEAEAPWIAPGDADRLDFLARQFRVIRGRAQWEAAFAAAAANWTDSLAEDEEELSLITPDAATADALQQKFDIFLYSTQPDAEARTMEAHIRWLEGLIGPDPVAEPASVDPSFSLHVVEQARQTASTAAVDIAALQALKEILRGMWEAERAAPHATTVSYAAFYRELRFAVDGAMFVPPPPEGMRPIPAADVIYARGLSFDAVAILGLGEGAFPATISEDPFLRDADRAKMGERFGFPLQPSTLSSERELFYDGVTRARKRLLLTRSLLADNGAEWVASPYWDETRELLGVEPERLAAEHLPVPEAVASWAELWQCAATDPAVAAYGQRGGPDDWPHIQHAALIWQARVAKVSTPWDGALDELATDLLARFGPDYVWSPSRLESYQTCAHLFYFSRVLDLAPRLEPAEGLDVRQLGHLYHAIFEQVYSRGIPRDEGADRAAFVREVADPILDAAPEAEGFRETPWWSQTREEIITHVVDSIMALDDGSEFRFLQAEAAFGFHGQPPLRLGEGDDQVLLRGLIDRVDRDEEGRVRIIDYKLGGKSAYSKRAFEEGRKLQLPLYALAAQEALNLGPVADGFYWHFRTPEASSFNLAGQTEEAIRTALDHARTAVRQIRRGVFPPEPPAGGCPTYCPAADFCWHYQPSGW